MTARLGALRDDDVGAGSFGFERFGERADRCDVVDRAGFERRDVGRWKEAHHRRDRVRPRGEHRGALRVEVEQRCVARIFGDGGSEGAQESAHLGLVGGVT